MSLTGLSTSQTDSTTHKLDQSIVHGMAWVGGIKWVGQVLTWIATIFVARILSPADYGIVAMSGAFLAIVTMISDFGIDLIVMNFRNLDELEQGQLHTASFMLGMGGFLVSLLAALPLSWFYQTPELVWVVAAAAFIFIPKSLKTVPYTLLQRDMQFKPTALIEGVQTLCQATIVMALAFLGFSYWSLVIAVLFGALIATILILQLRPQRFAWLTKDFMAKVLSYGWHVVFTRLFWALYTNSDAFIVGRMLGQTALGIYSFGLSLANVAVEKVAGISSQVTASLFGAVQHDHAALRRYLVILTEGFAFVSFPLTIGLALVADTLVPFVLGAKWEPMVIPLQILSVTAAYRSIANLPSQILFATKDSAYAVWNGIVSCLIIPLSFFIGSLWGLIGVSMVWAIVHPPINYRLSQRAFTFIGLRHREYWNAFVPAVSASLVMTLCVLIVKFSLPASVAPAIRLAAEIATGGASYVLVAALAYRQRIQDFLGLVRG